MGGGGSSGLGPSPPRGNSRRPPEVLSRLERTPGGPGPSRERRPGAGVPPRGEAKTARSGDARCGNGTGARWATPLQRPRGPLRARRECPARGAAVCAKRALHARGRRAGRASGAAGTRLRPSFAGSVGTPPAPRPNAAIFRAFPVSVRLRRRRGAGRRWLGRRPRPAGRNPKPKPRGITPNRGVGGVNVNRQLHTSQTGVCSSSLCSFRSSTPQ